MALYILTHRQIPNWNTYFYTPLHMSMLDNPDVKLQVKDYYPEIAKLNQVYGELSGIYYIWKNDNDNIKGTIQYRVMPTLSNYEINNLLKTYKFIAHSDYVGSLKYQFIMHHDESGKLWELIVDLVKKSGISQSVIDKWENFEFVLSRHIFITTKKYYDEYANWMFNIISQIQDKLNIHSIEDAYRWARETYPPEKNPDYQTRILGFISERLQTLYVMSKIDLNVDIRKEVYITDVVTTANQVAPSDTKYDYVIVGAGLYGCVFAHEMHKRGKKCLVIDKRDHIGGNCYSEKIEGIDVHKYGPHIFHTNNKAIWEYIQQFGEFSNFINMPMANYKGKLYNLPFNMNTFTQIWPNAKTPQKAIERISEQRSLYVNTEPTNLEERALQLVGSDIYNILIKGYSEKQWGMPATKIPEFVIRRLPLRFTFNNNYFNDEYQGIPTDGYTALFKKMLEGITVKLNEDFLKTKEFYMAMADRILFTGPIDSLFDYSLGHLDYRSLKFEHTIMQNVENYQGCAIMNYTDFDTPYTRIIEHKHFNKKYAELPNTVITHEYPCKYTEDSDPYYPINDEKNNNLFEQYKQLAEKYNNISFGGRLGEYKYYDMDKTIEAALNHKWLKDD